ncbi:MAG: sugar-binding domain-containing protein, partial [bacterium]
MREKLLFDLNWRFHLGHAANVNLDFGYARSNHSQKAAEGPGPSLVDFDDGDWRTIDVPHDWAIEQPYSNLKNDNLRSHGYHAVGDLHPEGSIGWYRRVFEIAASEEGRRISVEFDGVFRDSVVWINGHYLDRHMSGYTGFRYDLTDFLNYGGRNVLTVRADAFMKEGWFYEGAGIYRHVWLVKTDPVHVAPLGTCVRTNVARNSAEVTVTTRLTNESDDAVTAELVSTVVGANGRSVAVARSARIRLSPWTELEVAQKVTVKSPRLWSVDTPNLYRVESLLKCSGRKVDLVHTSFGIRTLRWDADRGFFLNGKSLKIKGVCCHQ